MLEYLGTSGQSEQSQPHDATTSDNLGVGSVRAAGDEAPDQPPCIGAPPPMQPSTQRVCVPPSASSVQEQAAPFGSHRSTELHSGAARRVVRE